MRSIDANVIVSEVKRMCIECNYQIGSDVKESFLRALKTEKSPLGGRIIGDLLKNAEIAAQGELPICQDTGMAVVFVEIGIDVTIRHMSLKDAINEGVRQGYKEGYLRKSVVSDPIIRKNSGDNTPAVIHYEVVDGDRLNITVASKGFGSENMSALKMLKPADGIDGIENFVVDTIEKAGSNPCPPIIVGVGIGGTFEKAALLAKKALMRPIGKCHPFEHIAELEKRLLSRINTLNIGPQGLGGTTTALGVNAEVYPTHIAGLPVAVNINCHASRHLTHEF
ncbi:fumarate hydratase [Fusibacter tunisiensis]|jgi:fumarate hydratase subunit alpha|uniref:Fumarate hydratase subunit alpha n=1 Tax=Fusibacter tunisiensis TaxID=1008308 RepID=A0ABS2MRB7_9FIRM|nr:fumarate hydratase [Fusibacter tunisiensis]MBM7561912.1 fumarate hydratase subunit alpha [Fusibacter tunisiensis]